MASKDLDCTIKFCRTSIGSKLPLAEKSVYKLTFDERYTVNKTRIWYPNERKRSLC